MLGFSKQSRYVNAALNDGNIKSGVFIGAVICILELWLFFRQLDKYVIPKWDTLGAKGIDSIILMVQKLGMRTLCEGVETKEQSEFLRSADCERQQGYLFG